MMSMNGETDATTTADEYRKVFWTLPISLTCALLLIINTLAAIVLDIVRFKSSSATSPSSSTLELFWRQEAENYAFKTSALDALGMLVVQAAIILFIRSCLSSLRDATGHSGRSRSGEITSQVTTGTLTTILALEISTLVFLCVKLGFIVSSKDAIVTAQGLTSFHMALAALTIAVGLQAFVLVLTIFSAKRVASFGGLLSSRLDSYVSLDDATGDEVKDADGKGKGKKLKHASLARVVALAWPERYILFVATIALFLSAAAQMVVPTLFSNLIGSVFDPSHSNQDEINKTILLMVLTFFVMSIFSFLRGALFTLAGERLVARFRVRVFKAIVRQDVAFFDDNQSGELQSRLANDTTTIQEAVTVNVSMGLRWAAQVIVGLVIIFIQSWKLSLLMLAVVPFLAIGGRVYGSFIRNISKNYQDALGKAGETAEQAFSCIRTVRSFSQEGYEIAAYKDKIQDSFRYGAKRAWAYGIFIGCIGLAAYLAIALVLWYGARLVLQGQFKPKDLNSFLLYTIYIAVALGGLSGLYSQLMSAVGASERMFELIDKKPKIDSLGERRRRSSSVHAQAGIDKGGIEFRAVDFYYPTRPDVRVLKGVSFVVEPGETVAFVGHSGSGKSTCVALISRFYDPSSGIIKIDGMALKDVDVRYLHSKIAMVSQEPTLFATTIAENIAFGYGDGKATYGESPVDIEDITVGDVYSERVFSDLTPIIHAAKQANAHDFIMSFPDGYKTKVGERGVQLSGGQKQRIAIARAILKRPKLLLLDEATSALDAESEYLVQDALDKLMLKSTTIVIAHRLSTIKNADCILVMQDGRIVERGTHAQLLGMSTPTTARTDESFGYSYRLVISKPSSCYTRQCKRRIDSGWTVPCPCVKANGYEFLKRSSRYDIFP